MKHRYLTTTLLLLGIALGAAAQALTDRYNRQRPLVIVCDQQNPPYEYMDDDGQPIGSNIDIVSLVMKRLHVPCEFVMKEKHKLSTTLKEGDADLLLTDGRTFAGTSYSISAATISFERTNTDSICETHLVGRDRQLIDAFDDVFWRLNQAGEIADIQERWLTPEKAHHNYAHDIPYIVVAILLLLVGISILTYMARRHANSIRNHMQELNQMMYKVLHMGNFDVMLYDIAKNRITNQYGNILPKGGITLEEYTDRIHARQRDEFAQKVNSMKEGRLRHFVLNKLWNQGTVEEPHYLNFQGHAISELDKDGRPAYIINAVYDVTHEVEEDHAAHDIMRKCDVIFSNPYIAMAFYDNNGNIIEQNDKMKVICGITGTQLLNDTAEDERQDIRFSKHVQPLYNSKGKVYSYLVTMEEEAVVI